MKPLTGLTGRKLVFFCSFLLILLISGVSTWRALAILGVDFSNSTVGVLARFGVILGFTLFWLAGLFALRQINRGQSWQRWLVEIAGAGLLGGVAFLLLTPAGLSRVTLQVYAENVWKPDIFSVTWTGAGSGVNWHLPLRLPTHQAIPVNLEIVVPAQPNQTSGEVWLLRAMKSSGQIIPFEEFQPEGGWQQQQVNRGDFNNQSVWVSANQTGPDIMRWHGMADGPITLLFAKHQQAKQVIIHWNGLEQIVDLYAPAVEFAAITLPLGEPVVWQANLPASAVAEQINLLIEPDLVGKFPLVIKKVKLTGSGYSLEVDQAQLLEALQINPGQSDLTGQFNEGRLALTGVGVSLIPRHDARPFQLTLDGPLTGNFGWSAFAPMLENGLVILYLAMAAAFLTGILTRRLSPGILGRINTVVISGLIALLLGEFGLQFLVPAPGKYYVRYPNQRAIFNPVGLIGVEGQTNFITNSQGFRADEFSPDDDYRILAVGGSTTQCLVLDQTEAWPQRLQDLLNEQNNNHLQVWVGNAGQGGRTTREHIMHLKYLLPQYPSIKAVVLMIGINDFNLLLSQGDTYNPGYLSSPAAEKELIERAFYLIVDQNPFAPYYQKSATWRLLDNIRQTQAQIQAAANIDIEDEAASVMSSRRERRKNAPIIKDELPDLSPGLLEYERNIHTLIDIAQAHHVRIILMTQPTLWRSDLSQAEEDLLWFGWGENREFYYSVQALMDGMSAYNQKLLEVCRQRQVECLDLANMLPKTTTIFFDDVHFNESGAEQVAGAIAEYMLQRAPFSSGD